MSTERQNRWEAEKMQTMPFSGIRKVSEAAAKLKAKGTDVVEMTMGRPDFDTPEHIKEAAVKALKEGKVHYTSNYGIPELREAIAEKMKRHNGLEYDPDGEIMVTVGAAEAIFATMSSFLDPGDEIIIPAPVWVNYVAVPASFGAKVVTVPLREENEFSLDARDVEKAVSEKTKMIVLVTPGNPTGGVIKEKDLKEIAELAKKHDLLVIADEVYEYLVYDGERHVSIGKLEGMKERTIVVNSVSKTYSMTGWRIGWICADRPLMLSILRAHQYMVACAVSFAQYGAWAALKGPQDCVREMTEEFDRRRKYIVSAVNSMDKMSCITPKGAFYVFANIKKTGLTSEEASRFLLDEAHVAAVPGSAFGKEGEGFVRFAYSTSMEEIKKAMERIDKALRKL
ncbi:MAG TPA: pyridoxal phosphate-dependent aminotransferase [Candidatus Copromorpha excrementigallinarum]|uniref:Aminotransferase n=1 Tax=Candidatus Allocopromorpha excrementigallinarum TaxID=2840742 RepID=A0A9D1L6I0_9FIRM|nr:pyridoxal phosphate-dependent aminotransferase [Candidatus Copromorpha excrementigallinarum]